LPGRFDAAITVSKAVDEEPADGVAVLELDGGFALDQAALVFHSPQVVLLTVQQSTQDVTNSYSQSNEILIKVIFGLTKSKQKIIIMLFWIFFKGSVNYVVSLLIYSDKFMNMEMDNIILS
jgi:hypothetical protein